MMLHLGVLDVPYDKGGKTTAEVAKILEDRYHIMEVFYETHAQEIADDLAQSMNNELQDLLSGAAPKANYGLTDSEDFIKALFVKFIDSKGMEGLSGSKFPVPTGASLRGINHRLMHPFAKGNPARPSFVDSGKYEQSFRAEFEV